jgi:hypothetical protein
MNPLNPWAIAIGVLAIGIPTALHFLTKPKPTAIPISTISFLYELIQQRRAKSKLRDILVLLLRSIAIALIALTIARPRLAMPPVISPNPGTKTARVVILDQSQSMAAGQGTSRPWERAQATSLKYLAYSDDMQAGVIFAGVKARSVYERLSSNFESLSEAIKKAKPKPENVNVADAIDLAGDLLEDVPEGIAREVVIISDFQRSDWGALSLESLPADTKLVVEQASLSEKDNIAIVSARPENRVTVKQPVTIQVEIANHTPQERNVECRVIIEKATFSAQSLVPAQGTSVLNLTASFDEPGWRTGYVSLNGNLDVQPLDDSYPIAFEVSRAPSVLIVTRQSVEKRDSSSYFLQQALTASLDQATIKVVRSDKVLDSDWNEADLIVLSHPGQIPKVHAEKLAAAIRRGRGLLLLMSEPADGANHNSLAELWGQSYQSPVQWTNESRGESRRGLFVAKVQTRQLPFQVFGDSIYGGLANVKLGGGLPTVATREGLKGAVSAELSDGSAWLTITDCEAGKVAVMNCDLQKSNLVQEGIFVPIMAEISKMLLQRDSVELSLCGLPIVRTMPIATSASEPFVVRAIDSLSPTVQDQGKFEFSPTKRSVVWTWPESIGPGLYEVVQNDAPVFALATTVPASEADLTLLDEAGMKMQLEGVKQRVGIRNTKQSIDEQIDTWWTWLALACTGIMLLEVLILLWFRT